MFDEDEEIRAAYHDVNSYLGAYDTRRRAIAFRDTKPRPIKTQTSLVEYFERIKRHKADAWQKHLCDYLQAMAEGRHEGRSWVVIHAEGQLGKTSAISHCYPAWLIGHDPLFRFALAMYNTSKSRGHSSVVIQIMQSEIHQSIFPDKAGMLYSPGSGEKVSKEGWMTTARRELNDGQLSFNPVGLQSGLVGVGFDHLGIDDPYRESKEAFSEQIRENLQNFWTYTVLSRADEYTNITGMFHRYSPEDLAGYLLDTGDFDYLRYASECDGDYIHESTGRRYPDPLGREEGELISPDRRGPNYYIKPKQNKRVWLSMFQGRPSSEEGEFFNVGRITTISPETAEERLRECVALSRSYDIAATEEEGAYTVGIKMGIRTGARVTIFGMYRKRVDTAARLAAQKANGKKDGTGVVITIPRDPGAAGKDSVFFHVQELKDFTVVEMPTAGLSKVARALPASAAVNSGDFEMVDDSALPEDDRWNKDLKRELRDFPLSAYKDIVDALSDGYTYLYQTYVKGKIVTNYEAVRSLINWQQFGKLFPAKNAKGEPVLKVPEAWNIYAGVKTSADASLPNCGIIVARASENTDLEDTIFVLAEYKEYDASPDRLFTWLYSTLTRFCRRNDTENTTIWMHPDSMHFADVIRQKIDVGIAEFNGDKEKGYPELNWYFMPTADAHPFVLTEKAPRMYLVIKPGTELSAMNGKGPDSAGLYHLRQEIATCGFNDKGEPAATCQVLDVLRMCVAGFSTIAAELSYLERIRRKMGPAGQVQVGEHVTPERQAEITRRQRVAQREIDIEDGVIEDEKPAPIFDIEQGRYIDPEEEDDEDAFT